MCQWLEFSQIGKVAEAESISFHLEQTLSFRREMSSMLWLFELTVMVTCGGDVLCAVSPGAPRTGCRSGLGARHPRVCHGETMVSGWHQLLLRPSLARVPHNKTVPSLSPINTGAWLAGNAPQLTGWEVVCVCASPLAF